MAESPNVPKVSTTRTTGHLLYGTVGQQSPLALLGLCVRETVGTAAAVIVVRDGTDATGTAVWEFSLTAGGGAKGSDSQWFGDKGIRISTGLFIDRTGAGSTEVVAIVH